MDRFTNRVSIFFTNKRSTESMTRVILAGSIFASISIILLLTFSYLIMDNLHVLDRIFISLAVLVYLSLVTLFINKKHPKISAWLVIALYGTIGVYILHVWGINAPIGVLILGFVIILTSVMIGTRHIPLVTISLIFLILILQFMSVTGLSNPDNSMLDNDSSFGDVAGYSIVFSVFAIIAWLSGRKTEIALARASKAESDLEAERDALASRVQEQTKRIIEAQQKELKQLYKFAELGQLTTIILHELANHLSILALDIDDLNDRHENSVAIKNAKESIFYIDSIIDQVRQQIMSTDDAQKFDALQVIRSSADYLKKKLKRPNIKLFVEDSRKTRHTIYGDPLRLSQVITILVTNAAQSTADPESEISITVSASKSKINIQAKDLGTGITPEVRKSLFKAHKSKKGAGLGIGLYITKQIIDTHFKGRVWLEPSTEFTQFNIELPASKQ